MTILTVSEARQHISTSLVDAALQRLLDDAEDVIVAYAGPSGSAVEILDGEVTRLALGRPTASITTIIERYGTSSPETLAADDFELLAPYVILRKRYGTNSSATWRGPVKVTYAATDDADTREVVQLELVKLEIDYSPGLASETVGAWTQTYASTGKSIEQWREEILARLRPETGLRVI